MKGKSKKFLVLCFVLVALLALSMVFVLTACKDDPSPKDPDKGGKDDPEDVTYKVQVVSLKTWTKQVKAGETLEQYLSELNLNPQKSGERFIGWFEDGSTTPYDWATPITKPTTIRAKFEAIPGLTIKSGTAYPTEDNGFETASGNTLYTYGSFEKGSFSVDVTPKSSGNDCGVIFGAESSVTGKWEDFSYYTLLINFEGIVLLAKMPWVTVVPGVTLSSVGIDFDVNSTYTITVKYSGEEDKYLECYVNEKLVIATALADGFYGSEVGCRAQVAGTVYGEMTFDENDLPEVPATDVGGFVVRNGAFEEAQDGIITTQGSSLAVVKDGVMGGIISFEMKREVASSDDGIVFALTDNENPAYWEADGTSYYFFFVDGGNKARLSKVVDSWNEEGRVGVSVTPNEGVYKFEVVFIGNEVRLFVNGVQCFVLDNALAGTSYGVRAKSAGVQYKEIDMSDKVAVIVDNGTVAKLNYIDKGTAPFTLKPDEDPKKEGYEFKGWRSGESDLEYNWEAQLNANVVVSAKFDIKEDAKFVVQQGGVEESELGYRTTAANTLIIMNNKEFTGGSVEVSLRHNDRASNDIAFIFGANVTEGATWENFDYFAVMINLNGTILFAKVNSWGVMASSAILESGYDQTATYTLKLLYTDGYARIYAKGGNVAEYRLAATVYIGALKGTSIGFRAQKAGTEFGETVTINAEDNLVLPSANTNISLTARCGGVTEDNGVFTTSGDGNGNYLAVSDTTLSAGGCVSVKMTMTDGDTGVIFGFSGTEDWEGTNKYYMLFLNTNGNVRAASFPWNQFAEIPGALAGTATQEHTLTVSWDGHGVTCLVDGVLYVAYDGLKLTGAQFGIRGRAVSTYSDWSVMDYSQITDSTLA